MEITNIFLSTPLKTTFVWIPKHIGIQENKIAHTTAKKVPHMFPIPNLLIPMPDLNISFTQNYNTYKYVDSTNNKFHSPIENPSTPACKIFTSKQNQVTLALLRIGHTCISHAY